MYYWTSEIPKEVDKVHYLSHQPVVRHDKRTTKIRTVFDASCSVDGPSLDQCFYSGLNLLAKIFDIWFRLRLNRIAILADIKQAREHSDHLRFLWHDSMHDQTIVIYRFLRVVFGVTSCPFLLNSAIRPHLEKYVESEKDVFERLRDDLYVDDQASGCETPDQGKLLDNKSNAIMNDAGFEKLGKYIKAKEVEKILTRINGP